MIKLLGSARGATGAGIGVPLGFGRKGGSGCAGSRWRRWALRDGLGETLLTVPRFPLLQAETRARNREVLYELSTAMERVGKKRQRREQEAAGGLPADCLTDSMGSVRLYWSFSDGAEAG